MKKYIEHCSQIGKIMTNAKSIKKDPKTAGEQLGETAKKRVEEAFLFNQFGIKEEISNKYIQKGNECEDASIKLFTEATGMFAAKNQKYYENEYFCGTPDIVRNDLIIDIKTSWSGSTYPWFDTELKNKDYFYQLQGYMDLTGIKKAAVVYCLTDATENLIQDEVRRTMWQRKMIDATDLELEQLEDEIRKQMTFGHVPLKLRIKKFEVDYDPEVIEKMKERVELCREYYEELAIIVEHIKK